MARRRNEIGIRLALGAERGQVVAMVNAVLEAKMQAVIGETFRGNDVFQHALFQCTTTNQAKSVSYRRPVGRPLSVSTTLNSQADAWRSHIPKSAIPLTPKGRRLSVRQPLHSPMLS